MIKKKSYVLKKFFHVDKHAAICQLHNPTVGVLANLQCMCCNQYPIINGDQIRPVSAVHVCKYSLCKVGKIFNEKQEKLYDDRVSNVFDVNYYDLARNGMQIWDRRSETIPSC